MAVKKEPVAPAPVVSDKKKALETAMPAPGPYCGDLRAGVLR